MPVSNTSTPSSSASPFGYSAIYSSNLYYTTTSSSIVLLYILHHSAFSASFLNPSQVDFNASEPPCASHLNRDLIRIADKILLEHNVTYVSLYGSLLGLIRSDTLMPWTAGSFPLSPSRSFLADLAHLLRADIDLDRK